MSDELKMVVLAVAAVCTITGILGASCAYQSKLDAAAPVVESCVKHPSTRSPFRTSPQ